MQDVSNIVDYYANLLIIQYHNKPKAKATIELLVRELVASGIVLDINEGYNVDTAIGTQLDILGKYIGVERMYRDNALSDMFSLETYTESDPTLQDRWGFVTYANYDTTEYNGVLNYNSVLTKNFFLIDEDYRQLLKLKIIKNYSNGSHKSVDDMIHTFFEGEITVEQTDTMEMTYTVPFNLSAFAAAAIVKEIMPKPLGVKIVIEII